MITAGNWYKKMEKDNKKAGVTARIDYVYDKDLGFKRLESYDVFDERKKTSTHVNYCSTVKETYGYIRDLNGEFVHNRIKVHDRKKMYPNVY